MKVDFIDIQNFRKLKTCRIDLGKEQTIFVGPNNSGKTSAMDSLSFFLTDRSKFTTRDFTLNNWMEINKLANTWLTDENQNEAYWENQLGRLQEFLPQIDIWLNVNEKEIHYVHHLIPTLDWKSGLLGIRLRFEPINLENLVKEFKSDYVAAEALKLKANGLELWPKDMWAFLDHKSKLAQLFTVKSYILDPARVGDLTNQNSAPQSIAGTSMPIEKDALKGLIKVSSINAQRGFSNSNSENGKLMLLSSQFREYYSKHLNPEDNPTEDDLGALGAINTATKSFDEKLKLSFKPSLEELSNLNYPGFGNPNITISSSVSPLNAINHDSAVQFEVLKNGEGNQQITLSLPEQTNGLGYQNLISMVFELIRFRDEWMKVGKKYRIEDENDVFEPLHLVLIEEPEAHLHAQIQQVFINKAYDILRSHANLGKKEHFTTQLIVSTHSNHIAHEVDFGSLRYFKRILPEINQIATSRVINLSKTFGKDNATTKFAIRYLKTTHCDLFFADAIILIEGSAERMLVPHFIKQHHDQLATAYLSLVEIAGSHAHKLKPLIEDLGVLTLIITDIDPIASSSNRISVLPSKGKKHETGNSTISKWVPAKKDIDILLDLKPDAKISSNDQIRVAFQINQHISINGSTELVEVHATSFEDSLIYSNIELFKKLKGFGLIKKFKGAIIDSTPDNIESKVYDVLRESKPGDKAAFALDLLFQKDPKELNTPQYIEEGLLWLEEKLMQGKQL